LGSEQAVVISVRGHFLKIYSEKILKDKVNQGLYSRAEFVRE